MSLSGNLELFPLEEVLRLLARSRQNGCLRVQNSDSGRIYMQDGALTFATVEGDDTVRDRLVASGLATEDDLRRLEVSGGTLSEVVSERARDGLVELIREHCIESLYRIRRPRTGQFEFSVDARPRYPTGEAFDIESLVTESERRAVEWADIESVVPDLSTPWRMVPEIDEDSVNLSDTAWRFLAALEGACSVDVLAARLGLTTFQTARHVAELSRARLVEPVVAAGGTTVEPVSEPISVAADGLVDEVAPAPSYDPSWLDEYESSESEPEPSDEGPFGSDLDREPQEAAAHFEAEDDATSDESFLETVFSELEKSEHPEESDEVDEDDQGFGILRRRGLGAAFRELADS